MNDEAAAARGPSGPSQDVPAADPPTEPIGGMPPPPPPPPPPTGANLPPWAAGLGTATFSRDKLVRPRQDRYVAGVCGALARATNTDPVLWRVLLAVLGVLSGVGVLLYLIGWLAIPSEGETASPIESLLGKGRSGMSPLAVVLLGGAAVLSFAFILNDGMRASLLIAAVILGAVLLIKRGNGRADESAAFSGTPYTSPPPPDPMDRTAEFGAAPGFAPPPPAAPAPEPVTEPLATTPLATPPATPAAPPPPFTAPSGGYRPPFAPHGPYAPRPPEPAAYTPQPQHPTPPKPPKRPRERSRLGRLTFFALIVVLGVLAAIDTGGASIAVSAYFAAALVTIALGLVVGAWFGRARGLIALAILATAGLFVSTGAERWGGEVANSVYRPATLRAVADRYDFTAGNATLDLRAVDFADQQQDVVVTMKIGQLKVLLPENVDTTATLRMQNGRAVILGKEFDGRVEVDGQQVSDLGTDGPGGGTLRLDLQMDTGNVEVHR